MKFTEKQLLDALRELERPTSFWVLFRHVTLKDPKPPSDPDGLVRDIKTVLNIAVRKGLVDKKDMMYCLAPRSEGDKATADDKGFVKEKAGNVAGMASSKDEEIIVTSFMVLPKLTTQGKKSNAHKRGSKRKLEIPAEIVNTVDNSSTKGLMEEKHGELIEPSLMILPKLARLDSKSHAARRGRKPKQVSPADNITGISGTKRCRKKEGMYCLAPPSEASKNTQDDKDDGDQEAGNVASMDSPMDEGLIKAAYMEITKLARQHKKSQVQKRGGANVANMVSPLDEEVTKEAFMEFTKSAGQHKKSQVQKLGRKRKLESTPDNSGTARRRKNEGTRPPKTSSSDDYDPGADSEHRDAKDKRGRS